ncbi:hypothetical protein DFH07DRAFT_372111 [Mycena maculata]|uniref:Transmembrane protein n=1 Tax=Mycena maculata TaxID=230809 RepID=A0AAD7JHR4_9AGAR|nr:hypothetical protein DFH07DRAFT_372111 [Mycena maculata]
MSDCSATGMQAYLVGFRDSMAGMACSSGVETDCYPGVDATVLPSGQQQVKSPMYLCRSMKRPKKRSRVETRHAGEVYLSFSFGLFLLLWQEIDRDVWSVSCGSTCSYFFLYSVCTVCESCVVFALEVEVCCRIVTPFLFLFLFPFPDFVAGFSVEFRSGIRVAVTFPLCFLLRSRVCLDRKGICFGSFLPLSLLLLFCCLDIRLDGRHTIQRLFTVFSSLFLLLFAYTAGRK